MQDEQQPDLVSLRAEIVSAYVAKNHIKPRRYHS
jgi:predicted transcriptional regulator